MQKIIIEDKEVEKFTMKPDEALDFMKEHNQPYKVELIEDLAEKGADLTFRRQGEFVDLCAGTHLMSTG